jgi:hypothetical protein
MTKADAWEGAYLAVLRRAPHGTSDALEALALKAAAGMLSLMAEREKSGAFGPAAETLEHVAALRAAQEGHRHANERADAAEARAATMEGQEAEWMKTDARQRALIKELVGALAHATRETNCVSGCSPSDMSCPREHGKAALAHAREQWVSE